MRILISILIFGFINWAHAGKISSGGDELPSGPIWTCLSTSQSELKLEIGFQHTLKIYLAPDEVHVFPEASSMKAKFVFEGGDFRKPMGFTRTFLIGDRWLADMETSSDGVVQYIYSEQDRPLPNQGFTVGLSIYLSKMLQSKERMGAYKARMSWLRGNIKSDMVCTHTFPSVQPDPVDYVY